MQAWEERRREPDLDVLHVLRVALVHALVPAFERGNVQADRAPGLPLGCKHWVPACLLCLLLLLVQDCLHVQNAPVSHACVQISRLIVYLWLTVKTRVLTVLIRLGDVNWCTGVGVCSG